MALLKGSEDSRWKDYDDSPDGKSIDNVEHAIGCEFQLLSSKLDKARNLIEAAEGAKAEGDSERAQTCLDDFHRILRGDYLD